MHYIVIPTVLYFFKLFDTKTILEISEKKERTFFSTLIFLPKRKILLSESIDKNHHPSFYSSAIFHI